MCAGANVGTVWGQESGGTATRTYLHAWARMRVCCIRTGSSRRPIRKQKARGFRLGGFGHVVLLYLTEAGPARRVWVVGREVEKGGRRSQDGLGCCVRSRGMQQQEWCIHRSDGHGPGKGISRDPMPVIMIRDELTMRMARRRWKGIGVRRDVATWGDGG